MQPQMMLGETMAREALGPLVHSRFLKKGRWVHALRFRVEAGLWVFQKGVVLGAHYRDDLEVLARCWAIAGKERASVESLRARAEVMLKQINAKDGTFYGLWSTIALNGFDFNLATLTAQDDKEQMRLGEAMNLCNEWMVLGAGFGGTFPEEAVRVWRATYEHTEQDRSFSRTHGLPTPNELRWEDVELGVMEDLSEYVTESFPELLEPLGLKSTRSTR